MKTMKIYEVADKYTSFGAEKWNFVLANTRIPNDFYQICRIRLLQRRTESFIVKMAPNTHIQGIPHFMNWKLTNHKGRNISA